MELAQISNLATHTVFLQLQFGNDGIGRRSFFVQYLDAVSSGAGHSTDPLSTSLFVSRGNFIILCLFYLVTCIVSYLLNYNIFLLLLALFQNPLDGCF